jgi:ribonuclease P protein subunit RPR2
LTEKIRGPSQVVATRMYSSISGAILRKNGFSGIREEIDLGYRNRFYIWSLQGRAVRRRKDSHKTRDLAIQRMERLFMLATEAHKIHPERSNRYVQIACRISTRTRIRMPRQLKRLFCKHCGSFLSPSGARVRLREGVLTTTCLACGKQTRRPYIPTKGICSGQDSSS